MVALHTVCALLSYVAFLIGLVAAMLFLVQERQLKRKRMGWWFHRLPPLEVLDRANFLAIGIGFALLTIGVACGVWEVRLLWGRWWTGDPKEYLTLGLWAAYCSLWVVRLRATLRGRRVALLSILGCSLALFAFLGAHWWLHSWHSYV